MIKCGQCTYCCKNSIITLVPGDDPKFYKTREWQGVTILQTKINGDCIYLDGGCSIYPNRPMVCKSYHCIDFYDYSLKLKRDVVINDVEFKKIVTEARKRNDKS